MIAQYESITALLAHYKELGAKRNDFAGDDWYNNETHADTLRMTEQGDTRLVPEAERLLEQLDASVETERLQWERSPSGAYCVVPDVLAGLPTPMRRLVTYVDDRAPISIFVVTNSSAGIDASILEKRGTVIMALVLALARTRSVRLCQLTCTDGPKDKTGETIITGQINTNPLDLATACYVLTSAGFARDITYGLAKKLNNFSGRWPKNFNYDNPKKYYDNLIKRLVPAADQANTMIIPAAQLGDTILRNPFAWVQHHVNRFTKSQQGEDAAFFNAGLSVS